MNLLFLHLPDSNGTAHAWLRREDGLADLGRGEPAQFSQQYPASPCIVFLPSSLCLFASAAISAKQLRQAEQSLAWLIEEQTGEDAEDLHVLAGTPEGDVTPLLAISRETLADWLTRLRTEGLHPVAVLPDLFLLPRDDSDWQLLPQGERFVLRTGPLSGAVLESGLLELMLDGALLERDAKAPLAISIAAGDPEAWARIEQWVAGRDHISCRLSEQLDAATAIAGTPDWSRHPANLLQGTFAAGGRLAVPATLRRAAIFLAAAFAVQLASEWMHYGYYRYQVGSPGTELEFAL